MISQKVLDALNEQLNWELYSAYIYLAMESYANDAGLTGLANWMRAQVLEEMSHADKFMSYINQQGGRVELKAIAEPPKDYSSMLDAFEKTLAHEKEVTKKIYALVDLARENKDHATENFLQWYVSEQVEEESSVLEIIQKLRLIGGDGNGLLMIDNQLATRVFTPPAAV